MQRKRVYDPTQLRDLLRPEPFIIEGLNSLNAGAINKGDLSTLDKQLTVDSVD